MIYRSMISLRCASLGLALGFLALLTAPVHGADDDASAIPPTTTVAPPVPEASLDIRRDATVIAVERVMPSVVNIATRTWVNNETAYERMLREFYGYRREPSANYNRGSGVVISEDGYILTNVHVVRGVDDIWVQFNDDSEPIPAERVALSQDKDVALLRLKPSKPRKFRAVKFAKDNDLLLGETVIALGYPFGLRGSVSRGILSSKSRRASDTEVTGERLDIGDWLQTDAAINPGNSGGPLVNLRGELIGLNVAVLRPDIGAQGIGFAIPIHRVNQALAETLTGESVDHFWFGARLKPGLRPLTVQSVQPGSPADKAGIEVGDAILSLDGKPAGSVIDFNRTLVAAARDREVELTLRRNGESRKVQLRLVDEKAFFNNELLRRRLGLTLRRIDGGFVIQTVERGGPASTARLQPGHFVTSIDGQQPDDLVGAAKVIYNRAHGDQIPLQLLVVERSGFLVNRYAAEVTLKSR
jgi:S1-C subfamily serine protease